MQVLNRTALEARGHHEGHARRPRAARFTDAEGEPTGVLENADALLVTSSSPRAVVPEEDHLDALGTLLSRYHEVGITSIIERNSNVEGYRTYEKLKARAG